MLCIYLQSQENTQKRKQFKIQPLQNLINKKFRYEESSLISHLSIFFFYSPVWFSVEFIKWIKWGKKKNTNISHQVVQGKSSAFILENGNIHWSHKADQLLYTCKNNSEKAKSQITDLAVNFGFKYNSNMSARAELDDHAIVFPKEESPDKIQCKAELMFSS